MTVYGSTHSPFVREKVEVKTKSYCHIIRVSPFICAMILHHFVLKLKISLNCGIFVCVAVQCRPLVKSVFWPTKIDLGCVLTL